MNDSFNGHPSLSKIASSFFDQNETKALYPQGTSNRDFIESVYQNLFNREPDTLGWNYWEDKLNATNAYGQNPELSKIPKNSFILAAINGAKDSTDGLDKTILQNKETVGLYFANAGLSNVDFPKEVMSGVSADSGTVDFIKDIINHGHVEENVWDAKNGANRTPMPIQFGH